MIPIFLSVIEDTARAGDPPTPKVINMDHVIMLYQRDPDPVLGTCVEFVDNTEIQVQESLKEIMRRIGEVP
jgi:hypothetical protein